MTKRKTILVLALVVTGVTAFNHSSIAHGATQAAIPSSSSTLPPVPPGFNPLSATAAQLQEYGFPPKPTNPVLLQGWETAMENAKTEVSESSTYSSTVHAPPSHPGSVNSSDVPTGSSGPQPGDHSDYYFDNWAGHAIPFQDFNDEYFTQTQAAWSQPSVPGNSSYTNYQSAPDASFWTGIGYSDIIQAGADSISTSTPTYKFWIEDYPQGTEWQSKPTISPGNSAYVSVQYDGNNESSIFLENETTGAYLPVTLATPDVGYSNALFINERLGNYVLPNYGSSSFNDCGGTVGGQGIDLTTDNNIVYMTSDGTSTGTPLVDPSGVNNSNASFSVTWKNGGP